MKTRGLPNRSTGFTLVEVLVALMVMAIMAMMAWRGLDALLQSRDIAQTHLDQSARLQTVLAQWEQDLRAVQATPVVDAVAFDGASLRLTRQRPGGMQVVAWTVRNGGLYRWEGQVVQTIAALRESYQRGQQLQAQDSVQLRALEGVAGWQMYYYRGTSWTNAQSTGDTSDDQQGNSTKVPDGVRMVIQFDAATSGFGGPLTRQVQLWPAL